MTRDERQEIALNKWVNTGYLGTIEAVTGFGKTRIATNAIKLLRRNDATRSVVIVVPTIPLKKQWEEGLQALGLSDNAEVYVINSLIRKPPFNCTLLILDEIHRYAAETFSKVFETALYSFVLGLTATLKRLDEKHELLVKYAPIRDRVTMLEAKRNGWVAPYAEYNLGIELGPESAEKYREMRTKFGSYMDKYGNDFELMRKCSYSDKPYNRNGHWQAPGVVHYARRRGWRGNNAQQAGEILIYNQTAPRGEKRDMWGNASHPYSPQKLYVYALQGMKMSRDIVSFCYNHPSKILAAERLINEFSDSKALTFCQTTDAADNLAERLGNIAMTYHSNMEGEDVSKRKMKYYKTEKGALKFLEKNPDWKGLRKLADGRYSIYTMIKVRMSPKALREEVIRRLQEWSSLRVVCTAKALDQGFDYPGCNLGIIYARTSSPTQQVQRTGRLIRKHFFEDGTEKRAVVVNIYLKDTKDYQWLNKAQKNSAGARWVDTIEEILESENIAV